MVLAEYSTTQITTGLSRIILNVGKRVTITLFQIPQSGAPFFFVVCERISSDLKLAVGMLGILLFLQILLISCQETKFQNQITLQAIKKKVFLLEGLHVALSTN